ncbi:hypothetical protein [Citrobacter braakii]|uniref:hypothetical protein n=1 Tax=Citrobacter braakii TaxID=57706 RepID=UPI00403993E5
MTTRIVELENGAWTQIGDKSASVEKLGALTSVWLATGTAEPDFERSGHFLRSGELLTVELSDGESLYAWGHAASAYSGQITIIVTE